MEVQIKTKVSRLTESYVVYLRLKKDFIVFRITGSFMNVFTYFALGWNFIMLMQHKGYKIFVLGGTNLKQNKHWHYPCCSSDQYGAIIKMTQFFDIFKLKCRKIEKENGPLMDLI